MPSNQNRTDTVTPYKMLAAAVIKQAVHEYHNTLIREAMGTNATGEKVFGLRRESSRAIRKFIVSESPFHRCLDLEPESFEAMADKAKRDAKKKLKESGHGWGKKKPPEPK
jgi:hypothetical protein